MYEFLKYEPRLVSGFMVETLSPLTNKVSKAINQLRELCRNCKKHGVE